MQLPPLSSSSYTVIPEKSFHLCHTYTFSNTSAHNRARKHTLRHISFFPRSSVHFELAAPVSTQRQHNTVLQLPNLLFNSAYSAKPICFCTNHLLILLHSFFPLTMVPSILHILVKTPIMRRGMSLLILDCEFCYPAVVRG